MSFTLSLSTEFNVPARQGSRSQDIRMIWLKPVFPQISSSLKLFASMLYKQHKNSGSSTPRVGTADVALASSPIAWVSLNYSLQILLQSRTKLSITVYDDVNPVFPFTTNSNILKETGHFVFSVCVYRRGGSRWDYIVLVTSWEYLDPEYQWPVWPSTEHSDQLGCDNHIHNMFWQLQPHHDLKDFQPLQFSP